MVAYSTSFAADNRRLIVLALRLFDVLAVIAAGVAAYWLRHGTFEVEPNYVAAMATAAFLAAVYMHFANLYSYSNLVAFSLQFGTVTATWGAVFVTLIGLAYFTQLSEQYSRFWVLTWFTITLVIFGGLRVLLAFQVERLSKSGELDSNIAVVGAGDFGRRLIRFLNSRRGTGIRIVGVYDDRKTRVPEELEGYPVRGDIDDLLAHIRTQRIDEVVVAVPWRAGGQLRELISRLQTVATDVKLCPEEILLEIPNLGYGDVAGIPMLKLAERPLSGWSLLAKAIEDRVLGSLLLLAFLPIMVPIAIAIRLTSKGPVFFRQPRYGFNNNEFSVLKFRTMYAGEEETDIVQAQRNDPRITPLGRFLRRTSLDELPQLINVIKGEMSLVGPRPHAISHNEEYAAVINEYLARHRVKPGITGWAQVNGFRGETRTVELMRQRVRYDLYYIENWSVLFDFRILLMTLFVGFVNRNAY